MAAGEFVAAFEDPEPVMRRLLLDAVPGGVPVATLIPRDRPARMVRFAHLGGRRTNPVTELARFVIDAWAPDADGARELADRAREHLERIDYLEPDYAWEEEQAPIPYPDPDVTDWVRYQQVGVLLLPAL